MFSFAVTPIFILLLYKRCITETALQILMMLRGWQRLLPNIWNYSNKRMGQKVVFLIVEVQKCVWIMKRQSILFLWIIVIWFITKLIQNILIYRSFQKHKWKDFVAMQMFFLLFSSLSFIQLVPWQNLILFYWLFVIQNVDQMY